MKKQPLRQQITQALASIRRLSPEQAKQQSSFYMAQDLSAIEQCISSKILDQNGKSTPRTQALIDAFHAN